MVSTIEGIEIGQRGDSRLVVVEAFAQKGAKLASGSVPELRAGRMSGDILRERVICAEVSKNGTPDDKDTLYEKVGRVALRLRQKRDDLPNAYNSTGFTNRIANFLEIDSGALAVDRLLRAMRIEASMSAHAGLPAYLINGFGNTALRFIEAYNRPAVVRNSPSLGNLIQARDEGTVFSPDNFYRLIYKNPSSRFIGAWATFEVGWLAQFYSYRLKQTPPIFSPLDKEVLGKISQGQGDLLPGNLAQQTGIKVDRWVVAMHHNALLGRVSVSEAA